MLFSIVQSQKAFSDISSKPLGKTTLRKFLQPSQRLAGSFFTLPVRRNVFSSLSLNMDVPQPSISPATVASFKFLHDSKQLPPTYEIFSGIVTEVKPVPRNAFSLILSKLSGKSMLSNLLQLRNALTPICVTVSGNVTLASALHPVKVSS